MLITESNASSIARELTVKAIENNLFSASEDPAETAKDIVTFFNTIADSLLEKAN